MSIGKLIKRIILVIVLTVAILFAGLVGIISVVMCGPSENARDLMVLSFKESSALKWIPGVYLSEAEIEEIISKNSVAATDEITDTSLLNFGTGDLTLQNKEAIKVEAVSGSTFKGHIMEISDPSRVFVAPKGVYDGSAGVDIETIANNNDAIAGINGGGFLDTNGLGNGGTPDGIVISKGEVIYGGNDTPYVTVGFTNDNILVVGTMTGSEAVAMGMRDAVCVKNEYAPVLVVNGEPQITSGNGGGVNPRTAIGQKADGTVVFLVIDGRQASSLGATFTDLIEIMIKHDVVNACCMDGGNSSQMFYDGELISSPSSPTGARGVPNGFLVSR